MPPQQGSRVCSYFLHRGNCVHGDECAFSHDVAHVPLCRFYAAGRCRQGQRCHFAHRREPRRRTESSPRPPAPSLLRKLLEKEIRQEHTVILQCFRWLVENEYLQTLTTSRAGAPSCAPCAVSTLVQKPANGNGTLGGTVGKIDHVRTADS